MSAGRLEDVRVDRVHDRDAHYMRQSAMAHAAWSSNEEERRDAKRYAQSTLLYVQTEV